MLPFNRFPLVFRYTCEHRVAVFTTTIEEIIRSFFIVCDGSEIKNNSLPENGFVQRGKSKLIMLLLMKDISAGAPAQQHRSMVIPNSGNNYYPKQPDQFLTSNALGHEISTQVLKIMEQATEKNYVVGKLIFCII